MIESTNIAIVTTLIILASGTIGLGFIGAFIYDVSNHNKQRYINKHKKSRKLRRRPIVSVAVIAENSEKTLEHCLNSIISSSYRNCEIIIIDNVSSDSTRTIAKNFKHLYPKKNIKLHLKRKRSSTASLFESYITKNLTCEFVLYITGETFLSKDCLKNSVNAFLLQPNLSSIHLNSYFKQSSTVISLASRYNQLITNRFMKLRSITRTLPSINNTQTIIRLKGVEAISTKNQRLATIYRKPRVSMYLSSAVINKRTEISYRNLFQFMVSEKLLAFNSRRSRVDSFQRTKNRRLKKIREMWNLTVSIIHIMPFSQAIIYASFVFLSIISHSPTLFCIGWGITILALALTIAGDEQLSFKMKMHSFVYIPIMYLVFCITAILEITSSISCMVYIITNSTRNYFRRDRIKPTRANLQFSS